jgi:beta-lactamase regulating signal transducer with metallopeptidase domain
MKSEILSACDQAVASTVNGVYQGIILTALVALALRVLGRSNAATRHSIWMATLWILPGLIAAHLWLDPVRAHRQLAQGGTQERPQTVAPEDRSEDTSALLQPSPSSDILLLPLPKPDAAETQDQRVQEIHEIQAQPSRPPVPWDHVARVVFQLPPATGEIPQGVSEPAVDPSLTDVSRPARAGESVTFTSRIQDWLRSAVKRLAEPIYWKPASGLALPRAAGLVILVAWLLLASWRLALLISRVFQLRNLKRESIPAAEPLEELFHDLRVRLGLRRRVELRVSSAHHSPVVVGFLHPVVLLPPLEILSADANETEHILRHELAHVERADDWANLLQHFLQSTLFFHPAVWWVSRQVTLEREVACDDQVLLHSPCPRAYALVLANVASRLKRCPLRLAPGVSANKSQLQQRINMILDTKRNSSPLLAKRRMGFVTSAAALVAVLAIYSGPRLVLAETSATASPTPSPSSDVQTEVKVDVTAPEIAVAAPAGIAINFAQNEPAAEAGADESGPRYKSSGAASSAPRAVIIAQPGVPAPPAAANAAPVPPAPVVVAAPHVKVVPAVPGAPGYAYAISGRAGQDGSVEERVERLEQMVEALVAQQHGMHPGPGQPMWKGPPPPNFKMNEKDMAKMKEMAEREAYRAHEDAKRARGDAKRAAEDMKRAAKDQEKAMKEKGRAEHGAQKESLDKQLDGLRRAKEGLERQMERLDSQIEKLEQDQEKLQDEQEQLSEVQEEQAREQAALAEVETE